MTKADSERAADWSHAPVTDSEGEQYLIGQSVPAESASQLIKTVRELRGIVTRGDLFTLAMAFTMGAAQRSRVDAKGDMPTKPERLALPNTAPELYDDRTDRSENPIDFLNRVWEPWLKAGVLFQDQLSKRDPKLIPAIKSYCQRRKMDAKAVLPPPRHLRPSAVTGDEAAWIDELVQRQKSAAESLAQRYQRQK